MTNIKNDTVITPMAQKTFDAIFHPVRMRIITMLSGQQGTTAQIAIALPDVTHATLYRHLKQLLEADVIRVVDQRPVRGVMEKVYTLSSLGGLITPDSAEIGQMTADDWRRAFAAYTASLMGQFELYLQQAEVDVVKDGVSFRTSPLYLSDPEKSQFFEDLRGIIASAQANVPAPGRRRRLFSTILVPEADFLSGNPYFVLSDSEETEK